ncbi:MAG: histidine phosphatase family protein [Xanthomonadaceae bacterium]|jgi:phosphohistidine phosphatase SixA|nr:histidine phosphatase family protein [Xanthomonadaceae bacterium]
MRELILLRHANAEPIGTGQTDFDRALSSQGLSEAADAGQWLASQKLIPDRVLCSPARRTRETLEAVFDAIGDIEHQLESDIYQASPGTLIGLIQAQQEVERLMLVGHNPGMERLLALLHSGRSGDYRGMPTAGVAVLTFPAGDAIEPGGAILSAFWWP